MLFRTISVVLFTLFLILGGCQSLKCKELFSLKGDLEVDHPPSEEKTCSAAEDRCLRVVATDGKDIKIKALSCVPSNLCNAAKCSQLIPPNMTTNIDEHCTHECCSTDNCNDDPRTTVIPATGGVIDATDTKQETTTIEAAPMTSGSESLFKVVSVFAIATLCFLVPLASFMLL